MLPPELQDYRERFRPFAADPGGHAEVLRDLLHQLYPYWRTNGHDLNSFWSNLLQQIRLVPFDAQLPIWRSLRNLEYAGVPLFGERERLDRVLDAWEGLARDVGPAPVTPAQMEMLIAVFELPFPYYLGWFHLGWAIGTWCEQRQTGDEAVFMNRLLNEHNARFHATTDTGNLPPEPVTWG